MSLNPLTIASLYQCLLLSRPPAEKSRKSSEMLSLRGALLVLSIAAFSLALGSQSGRLWSDYPEPPVQSFAKRSVSSGPAVGPPLRPYTVKPLAHKLKTSSDTETRVGGALNLRVNTIHNVDTIESCAWTSPEGITYDVDKDSITVDGKAS